MKSDWSGCGFAILVFLGILWLAGQKEKEEAPMPVPQYTPVQREPIINQIGPNAPPDLSLPGLGNPPFPPKGRQTGPLPPDLLRP